MQVADNTPTKEITISNHSFVVPAPYGAGHTLTENEANVLNQTLAENLRNNFASTVAKAKEAAGGKDVELDEASVAELQAQLDAYIAEYEFGVRRSGGGAGPRLEPRERIALNLAKEKVRAAIRARGQKPSDFEAEKITSLAESLVAKDPAFLQEADRQLKAQQKVAAAEIDLSDLGEPEAKADESEGTQA